jgi:hypothetical protein
MPDRTANAAVQEVLGTLSEPQRQIVLRDLWQALGALIHLVSSRFEKN